jgi:hypothetical protein
MERIHRIYKVGDQALKGFLDRSSIPYQYEESIIGSTVFLLISESDSNWPVLAEFLAEHPVSHTIESRFSKQEIRTARWCTLGVTSHFGYPQPEDDFEYRRTTYSPNGACDRCGMGGVQVAPFRLRKAPTRKGPRLLQLNWVFDEFFVSSAARRHIEAAGHLGLRFEDVVLHGPGAAVPGWFQVRITEVLPPCIDTDGLVAEKCGSCSRIKYNYPCGEMLRLLSPPPESTLDIVKTSEWFGSGASARRLVLVSQPFVRMILDGGWRGVDLQPITT